jgi:ATP-dependent DNA ligase
MKSFSFPGGWKIFRINIQTIELIQKHAKAKNAILEAECVAVDMDTGEMRPFQELMHRRRKYGIPSHGRVSRLYIHV